MMSYLYLLALIVPAVVIGNVITVVIGFVLIRLRQRGG